MTFHGYSVEQIVLNSITLSMKFSRQEHWSGLSFHSPENLPDPGIKPRSPTLQAVSLLSEPLGKSYQFSTEYFSDDMNLKFILADYFLFLSIYIST